ncbi:hypothetical protein [Achromobacter xylosoxidans]|uniref:hypothetical protein n=1 Tax=Alcaligenes xylosoxydans xylosoxydans TaxID=85698 RepID=UPI001F134A0D|nr:hypothetical protein [Achromobacter xylosoxidans]
MQLDTRIPLMVQGPQIESPQNMLAQALQVRALQGRVQDQERMTQQRNALASVLGDAFNDQGRLQPGALGRIAQAAPDYAPQYAQLANTQQRLDRQDRMTDTSVAMKKQEWAQQGFAVSNTPQEAAAYIQNGVQSGILTPEEGQRGLSQIPQDPTAYQQWRNQINQAMMTAAQRAELEKGSYSAPAQSSQGFFQADRSGNVRVLKGPDGKPLMPVTLDATGQAAVAGAKTTATKEAEKAVAKPGQAIEAKAALDSTLSSMDRLRSAAEEALNDPNLGRVTGVMGMFPNMPGGGAADVENKLGNLKSQIGFTVLQAMRDASKTGGALGAISDKENELLQNNLAPLGKSQSTEQMRQSLQSIIDYVDAAKGRLNSTYQQQYGNVAPTPAQGQAQGGGVLSAPARTVVRTGASNGRKVVQYSDGTLEYAD